VNHKASLEGAREGESMTRKPNFTSSDPGAQGGALGLKLHGTRRSRAGGCSGDGGGVRIVPLNA
jgi:hypothetical protein